MELAARLKQNPPAYNVLFVANGAHHLALAGVRNFSGDHAIDADGKGGDAKKAEIESYRGFIGLDLTSRTPTVGLFAKSWFYNQMGGGSENILLNQFANLAKSVGRYAADEARRRARAREEFFVDGITGKDGRTWRSYLPSQIALIPKPRRWPNSRTFLRDRQRCAFVSGHALRYRRQHESA